MATVQIDRLNYVIALLEGQNTGSRYGILAREEGVDFLWSSLKFETDACFLSRLDDDVLCLGCAMHTGSRLCASGRQWRV